MHSASQAGRTLTWQLVCSRAFIRAVMEDPDYPVTSPTFTLQNIYDEHEGEQLCIRTSLCRANAGWGPAQDPLQALHSELVCRSRDTPL